MSIQPAPADPETIAALHVQDALHFRGLLVDIVDLGARLVRRVVEKAEAEPVDAPASAGPDPALQYANITRSIRRSMMLAQALLEPKAAPDNADAQRAAARKQIIRRVEDSLHREAPAEADTLHAELLERLEGPEFDDDLTRRPVGEIINEILADLGLLGSDSLEHWQRRTPDDIAVLCARAAVPRREGASVVRAVEAPTAMESAGDQLGWPRRC